MSPFKRPVGNAEEIAKKTQATRTLTDRKRSRRPVPEEETVKKEIETTTPSQTEEVETQEVVEENTKETIEPETKKTEQIDEPLDVVETEDENKTAQETEVTEEVATEEAVKEEVPLIKPKEGQTKLSGFTDERLLAFMKFYGVQHKKHAVAVLLDIAEGELPPLNDAQKVGYDSLMNSIKDIYAANHWSTEK